MGTHGDFHAPRADHPAGPSADLSEGQADAATRMLVRTAVRNGGTGPEFTQVLRMLGLLETPVGDARARPLGGTRQSRPLGDTVRTT